MPGRLVEMIAVKAWYRSFVGVLEKIYRPEKIADKPWVIALEVTNVERCV